MRYATTEQPIDEPITLHDARTHCRVDDTDEDGLLSSLIPAARRHCEQVLARALLDQEITVEWSPDQFIPRSHKDARYIFSLPVAGITSVTTIEDADGDTIDQSDYTLSVIRNEIRSDRRVGCLVYRAGQTDPSTTPNTVRQAMLLLIAHWYEHRSAVTTEGTPHEVQATAYALLQTERSLGL